MPLPAAFCPADHYPVQILSQVCFLQGSYPFLFQFACRAVLTFPSRYPSFQIAGNSRILQSESLTIGKLLVRLKSKTAELNVIIFQKPENAIRHVSKI